MAPPTVISYRADDDELIDIDEMDLSLLAEEIVKLMRNELRLEHERQGWQSRWR
jgi:hypothetical protein